MREILLISDTHGDISRVEEVIKKHPNIKEMIHAGDTYMDAKQIAEIYDMTVYGVRGNTDISFKGDNDKVVEIEEYKIFITHGHKYNVKSSINNLYYKALEVGANIIVFGHTHLPVSVLYDGILISNPGSLSRPRNGNSSTYAVLRLGVDIKECIVYNI